MQLNLPVPYIPSQNEGLIDWKKQGKKAVGYFCQSLPKEIIYAAGLLPVRILGDSRPIEQANEFWTRYSCYFSRSVVDLALKGDLDLLDGMVFVYSCDVMFYLVWRWREIPSQKGKFCYYLTRPQNSAREGCREFVSKELEQFKHNLESYFQVSITDEDLEKAINIYNQSRNLLQEIDSLKKENVISSVEAAQAGFFSMVSPPEVSNKLLKNFVDEVKRKRKPKDDGRVKLFVSGSMLANTDLFEVIEEEGGTVADDDLCINCRYSRENVPDGRDPLSALAEYYMAENEIKWQCASMLTENRLEGRLKHIETSVDKYGIKGVIFPIPLYCDAHAWDRVYMARKLEEKGVRILKLEQEGSMKVASVRNRISAFIETIKLFERRI
jgi:benzoyl-CoA reductase subunit C